MKQKKLFLTLAASAMIAAGFTSCSVDDRPLYYEGAVPFPVVDNFDEGSEIQNGSCEGSLTDAFWCHEWRTSEKQFDGTANIVRDPANLDNHCVAVVVRSFDEAAAAGNATLVDGSKPAAADNFASWDSQFFITIGADKAVKAKDKVRITMKVKADEEQGGIETQSHAAPGGYLHYTAIGNVNFTTEWKEFDSGLIEVLESPNWTGGIKAGSYTIALNLAKGGHNTYYFDDIRVEIVRYDPLDEGNAVSGGSFEYIKSSDAYWVHEWRTPEKQTDGQANIVVDPANPNNHCAAVVVRSNAEAMEAGNATVTDGNPLKEDFSNFADWDSQFFISFGQNQALKAGDKLKLQMKVKADVAQSGVGTQSHAAPGAYIHWYCLDNVNFTTEWADFEKEVEVSGDNSWGKAAAGMYTIAFNLGKGGHNTYYFDDIKVTITKAQ